jgi:hypothetical protein
MTPAEIARFWSLIDAGDLFGCWPWRGKLQRDDAAQQEAVEYLKYLTWRTRPKAKK